MKSRRIRPTAPTYLAAISALLTAAPTFAQSAQTNATAGLSREQVNPAQQVAPSRRQRPVDVFSGPTREGCTLSDDPAVSFVLKQAVIKDDANILTEREKQAVLADVIGRRITPREL